MSAHHEEMEYVDFANFRVDYNLMAVSDRYNTPSEYVVTFCDVDGNELTVHLKAKLAYNIASMILASYEPEK